LVRQQLAEIAVHQDFADLIEVAGQGQANRLGIAESDVLLQQ
jgi:hypothetical protein